MLTQTACSINMQIKIINFWNKGDHKNHFHLNKQGNSNNNSLQCSLLMQTRRHLLYLKTQVVVMIIIKNNWKNSKKII